MRTQGRAQLESLIQCTHDSFPPLLTVKCRNSNKIEDQERIYNSASRANYDMRFCVTFSENSVLTNVLCFVVLVIVEFELLFHSSFIQSIVVGARVQHNKRIDKPNTQTTTRTLFDILIDFQKTHIRNVCREHVCNMTLSYLKHGTFISEL